MNLWKAFALIMIGLLIIAAGIRLAYIESHSFSLDEEQKKFAINAAKDDLRYEIEGTDYNVTTVDKGRIISTASGDKKVALVIISYGNTTSTALVDIGTGDVVRKSTTEYTGWMTEHPESNRQRVHKWLLRK